MCGRYNLTEGSLRILTKRWEFENGPIINELLDEMYRSNYNVAPTHLMPVLTNEQPNKLSAFRWGLIPAWATDTKVGYNMINAKSETLLEKPVFKSLINKKRCLVPADGFYEWKALNKKERQPYNIRLLGAEPFCFAGLYDTWKNKLTGEIINSYTIITTEPNEVMKEVHDRMPAILHPSEYGYWLNPDVKGEEAFAVLKSYPAEAMEKYPVDTAVGSVANNHEGLMKPVETQGSLF